MVPLARNVRLTADINKKVIWFFAGLIMLGAVSIVGFQGGELTYGEGHYAKYYNQLFSSPPSPPPVLTEEMTETDLPGEETDQPKVETTPKPAEQSQPNSTSNPKTEPHRLRQANQSHRLLLVQQIPPALSQKKTEAPSQPSEPPEPVKV